MKRGRYDDSLEYISTIYDIEALAKASKEAQLNKLYAIAAICLTVVAAAIIFFIVA